MSDRKQRSDKGTFRGSGKTAADVVYTFRLSPDNPQEAALIKFLHGRKLEGVTLRKDFVEAFTPYMESGGVVSETVQLDTMLDKLRDAIDKLMSGQIAAAPGKKGKDKAGGVSLSYLQNLRKSITGSDE